MSLPETGNEVNISSLPLVSVIINCYNGELYLRTAIDSVLAQTYQNWEIIFWDNQSTDHSAELFMSYSDCRLKYFYAPKHTFLYEARGCALREAKGDFFAFLDVDDWWSTDKLERQIPLFSDPSVGIVCGNYWIDNIRKRTYWRKFKTPVATGFVLSELLKSYYVGMLTLVIRRSALESLPYCMDSRYHVIGDFDVVIRLSAHWKLNYVHAPIATCRLHDNNETDKHNNLACDEIEHWLHDMIEQKVLSDPMDIGLVRASLQYSRGMSLILSADKKSAFDLFLSMDWGYWKLRLCFALLAPLWVIRRLKK